MVTKRLFPPGLRNIQRAAVYNLDIEDLIETRRL